MEYKMKKNIRDSKGITIVALVITIIVLLIIASIIIYEGNSIIKEAKVQKQITNMLSIKSKIKGYSEEIDSKTWNSKNKENEKQDLFRNEYKIQTQESENLNYNIFKNTDYRGKYEYKYYKITEEALNNSMNLSDLVGEEDFVVFAQDSNGDYVASDIIYVRGIEYKNTTYYTLSELQELFEE